MAMWATPQWRAEAVGWLDARLAERGVVRVGEVEQPHVRPWATVLRADTNEGAVWLKAGGSGQAFEAELYGVLTRRAPGQVLAPLAVDVERAWLLLPDGGASLGESLTKARALDRVVGAFELVLPQYAALQRRLTPYVDELLAAGCIDMTPARMPERFDEALDEAARYLRGSAAVDRDGAGLLRRLVAHRPVFTERCAEMDAGLIPPSLQHDDLHAWNVFARDHERGAVFFDWGDSVVAHPFGTLLVTLRSLRADLETTTGDPRLLRVRDAYLREFADLAEPAQLKRLAELGCHVGTITRALTWARQLRSMPPEQLTDYDGAQLRWLLLSLVDDPLGDPPGAG